MSETDGRAWVRERIESAYATLASIIGGDHPTDDGADDFNDDSPADEKARGS